MQREFKNWPIDPNTTSGIDLSEVLNNAIESADTNSLGNTRPSYLEPGGIWSKGSGGAIDLYLWDGTKDVLIGGSASGDGGMVIADVPPDDPSVGDMWLRTPSMVVYVWNLDYWFQFPEHFGGAGGGAGEGGITPGTDTGQMPVWSGTVWEPTSAIRVHKTGSGSFLDVSGEFHIHPKAYPKDQYGGIIKSEYFPAAYDPWSGDTKNWNMTWFRPNDGNSDPDRRNGFDFYGDRFTVRLSQNPQDDPWDTQQIVFRADANEVDLGVRSYKTKVKIYGDLYMGMSSNFYNKLANNPDDKPGTTFCGGLVMLGSYIDGETLDPVSQAEIDDPSLIRRRAFLDDAAIDMTNNPLYGCADPDNPKWATLREKMAVTVEWIERNAIVSDENGAVVVKGNTQFGNSNDDQHVIIGDTYIGYTETEGKPNNDDTVGGTLFLNRGMIVGRQVPGSPKPTASIGMEGNVIFDLGDPVSDSCAVSKGYVVRELVGNVGDLEDDVDTNTVNIVNLYNEQIRQALQIQALQNKPFEIATAVTDAVSRSTKFSELKANLIDAMAEFL